MRSFFILALLAALVALTSAKAKAKTSSFCIASTSAQYLCTNHGKIGSVVTASCKGKHVRVKIDKHTGKASWADGKHAGLHIAQDQWPCSHWVIENHKASKQMCPKNIPGWWPVKGCMDVASGKTRKPGYVGTI